MIGFEESVWKRAGGGKYSEDIYVSAHVDDWLIDCKPKDIMTVFKITEYLGWELIHDHSVKTDTIVQKGNIECVLKTFGMWDCMPCTTPLDTSSRLSKTDCPQVVDPVLHHRYHSITGCLSYLVNMMRTDLAFAYSQLSMNEWVLIANCKQLVWSTRIGRNMPIWILYLILGSGPDADLSMEVTGTCSRAIGTWSPRSSAYNRLFAKRRHPDSQIPHL